MSNDHIADSGKKVPKMNESEIEDVIKSRVCGNCKFSYKFGSEYPEAQCTNKASMVKTIDAITINIFGCTEFKQKGARNE